LWLSLSEALFFPQYFNMFSMEIALFSMLFPHVADCFPRFHLWKTWKTAGFIRFS